MTDPHLDSTAAPAATRDRAPGRRGVAEPRVRMSPGVHAATLAGLLVGANLAWEAAFGHFEMLDLGLWLQPGFRTMTVVGLLTIFIASVRAAGQQARIGDLEALAPVLRCTPTEWQELTTRAVASSPRAVLVGLCAVPLALFVPSTGSTPIILLSPEWGHDLVRIYASVGLLSYFMGRGAYATWEEILLYRDVEAHLGDIDLLSPGDLAPFTRRGLRGAVLWFGGSTLASLIYIDQDFALATLVVLCGTVALGVLSLFLPLTGLRRRIGAAKRAELRHVRAEISRCRESALRGGDTATALAGWLAYEERIDEVREWPLDTPTLARFGLLFAIAVSSWLGGAIVERLLGLALDAGG